MDRKISIQTKPIDPNDTDFTKLFEFINNLMRKRGYPYKLYKGSYSWFPPRYVVGAETVAKFCYLGSDDYLFGLRKEECEKFELHNLKLLLVFGVRPKTEATFYGFPVHNDEKSREALKKFTSPIPEVPPDRQVDPPPDRGAFDIDDFLKQF